MFCAGQTAGVRQRDAATNDIFPTDVFMGMRSLGLPMVSVLAGRISDNVAPDAMLLISCGLVNCGLRIADSRAANGVSLNCALTPEAEGLFNPQSEIRDPQFNKSAIQPPRGTPLTVSVYEWAAMPAPTTKRLARAPGRRKKPAERSDRHRLEPARFIPPMKALSVDTVPAGRWHLEIKLDGYRAIALLNEGQVELWSRNRKPLTADYPEVVAALGEIRCANAVIDGEIVALDQEGRSRFQLLQGRSMPGPRPTIAYYVFDLLHHDGRSLLSLPIEKRQRALAELVENSSGAIRLSPVFDEKPEALLEAARLQGLEGIIAKMPGSLYEPDRRSGTWLKCKVHGEQEFVIGGFTPPKNTRPYFGAILVGYYEAGELKYAGKVGSGFDHARLKSLYDEFKKREIASCPFVDLPASSRSRFGSGMTASVMRTGTWVKPELVAQVRFTEWTDDGSLRHPVFLGLRRDKAARDVVREAPPVKAEDR